MTVVSHHSKQSQMRTAAITLVIWRVFVKVQHEMSLRSMGYFTQSISRSCTAVKSLYFMLGEENTCCKAKKKDIYMPFVEKQVSMCRCYQPTAVYSWPSLATSTSAYQWGEATEIWLRPEGALLSFNNNNKRWGIFIGVLITLSLNTAWPIGQEQTT